MCQTIHMKKIFIYGFNILRDYGVLVDNTTFRNFYNELLNLDTKFISTLFHDILRVMDKQKLLPTKSSSTS